MQESIKFLEFDSIPAENMITAININFALAFLLYKIYNNKMDIPLVSIEEK